METSHGIRVQDAAGLQEEKQGWALRKGLLSCDLHLSVSLEANLLFFSESLSVMDP